MRTLTSFFSGGECRNPSLRLATKARACKGVGQKWARESHFMLPRVQDSVKEWTPTFPSELPLWELESQWTFKSSEGDCRGQNLLDWKILYIIGKFLKCKCLKWACMTHLGTENTNYGRKKGHESNCQFDSRPLKVKNCPNYLACRWHVTYHWKAVNKGYNFVLDLTSIRVLHTKLWASKVAGVPILTKWHLGAGPMAKHKVYYKGKGGGFPQIRAVVSLMSPCLPVAHPCTKSVPIMH
jgi:hypothetical protein